MKVQNDVEMDADTKKKTSLGCSKNVSQARWPDPSTLASFVPYAASIRSKPSNGLMAYAANAGAGN